MARKTNVTVPVIDWEQNSVYILETLKRIENKQDEFIRLHNEVHEEIEKKIELFSDKCNDKITTLQVGQAINKTKIALFSGGVSAVLAIVITAIVNFLFKNN